MAAGKSEAHDDREDQHTIRDPFHRAGVLIRSRIRTGLRLIFLVRCLVIHCGNIIANHWKTDIKQEEDKRGPPAVGVVIPGAGDVGQNGLNRIGKTEIKDFARAENRAALESAPNRDEDRELNDDRQKHRQRVHLIAALIRAICSCERR
jgi:hypothetical protein